MMESSYDRFYREMYRTLMDLGFSEKDIWSNGVSPLIRKLAKRYDDVRNCEPMALLGLLQKVYVGDMENMPRWAHHVACVALHFVAKCRDAKPGDVILVPPEIQASYEASRHDSSQPAEDHRPTAGGVPENAQPEATP